MQRQSDRRQANPSKGAASRRRPRRQNPAMCGQHPGPSGRLAGLFDWDEFVRSGRARHRSIIGGLVKAHEGQAAAERVDEVLQETFLRMLQCPVFSPRAANRSAAEVESYFRHVARTVVIDGWRRRTAQKRGVEVAGLSDLEAVCLVQDPSPEARCLEADRRERLSRRMHAALPESCSERDHELLERVVFDEERPCDLARTSHGAITPGAAYIALHRMRRRLRGVGREALLN